MIMNIDGSQMWHEYVSSVDTIHIWKVQLVELPANVMSKAWDFDIRVVGSSSH